MTVDGVVAAEVPYLRCGPGRAGRNPRAAGTGLRDRDGQRLRSAMGEEAFDAEYAAGTPLTTDEVLALALGTQTQA